MPAEISGRADSHSARSAGFTQRASKICAVLGRGDLYVAERQPFSLAYSVQDTPWSFCI